MQTGGTYRELLCRWEAVEARGDVRVREIECEIPHRALLRAEIGAASEPVVALAAGVHGDEPAGPWALLELVEARALDPRCAYRIWPCLNPAGFEARSRTSAGGVDLNRTFQAAGTSPEASAVLAANRQCAFALSLDLHEDSDADGFYCYEYGGGAIGAAVIAGLERDGFAIDSLDETFAMAGPLDESCCRRERGRILADPAREAIALGGLSYTLALARGGARHALTFETPSKARWGTRVAMHRAAVTAAIAALLEESSSETCN
ncbi:MAG TPA: succinylglutamate desuccinylase/aspartoacylase family protein [Candidatus Babeliales bacterium]|nr:succinylglutamate desuccinylase/aspartoacylase family protein [Candidatus Babeliales bacterium]